jgi:hypothetical protein
MRLRGLVGGALLGLISINPARGEDATSWISDDAITPFEETNLLLGEGDQPLVYDEDFELAQAAAPAPSRTMATRTAGRAGRTSRVPYMIGDQEESPHTSVSVGMGNSIGFEGIDIAQAEHPILFGTKFNAAENAISFPTDRVYVNYRHFEGAHDVNVLGRQSSLALDRFDTGFEKTALDGLMSVELRVPVVRQLNSDLVIFSGPGGGNLPVSDRHGELGNLGVNLKMLLLGRPTYGISAGVGVSCPTAEDTNINMTLSEPDFTISQAPFVSSTPPTNLTFIGQFDNDTINLVPYLAWFYRPSRFFHQGFLQVDTPLNRSDASVLVSGEITPTSTYGPETFNVYQTGELDQQTLLRANAGFGYWLSQGGRGGMLQGVAALFEAHYTTALDDANPFVVPVTTLSSGSSGVADVPLNVVAGPAVNNIDIVNLTGGIVADLGSCQITNGIIVPVTEGDDRQFDLEYCLQMNHRF